MQALFLFADIFRTRVTLIDVKLILGKFPGEEN